jgi:RecJ-like exonuclease
MMKDLFEKLAGLADELDKIAAPEIADEVDSLLKGLKEEVGRRVEEEEAYMTVCPICEGTGAGEDSPWCSMCRGGNKWVVLDKHNGKVLSEHDTEEKAKGSLKAMHVRK